MSLSWNEIQDNAIVFSKRWSTASDEKSEAQSFLNELFSVFGVDRKRVGTFEYNTHPNDKSHFIDCFWPGRIIIEMKSKGKSLDRAYSQAKQYAFEIKSDEDLPQFIMVCDFDRIHIYNLITNQNWEFQVKDLKKNVKKLSILTDQATKYNFFVDQELNTKAAYKMALLHDELKRNKYVGHDLEVYLVRLLFCLFADDSGIFPHNSFYDYISKTQSNGSDLSGRLAVFFQTLNTDYEYRQSSLSDELKNFPYVNGGLFSKPLTLPAFSSKTRDILLECSSFDWSKISPSIFGSMFQGVLDETQRRSLGAHYTSEQNILKVIKPLFLDNLYLEFEKVKHNIKSLDAFHQKLGKLTFFDPACGCGNFLIIAYRELRILELEVLKMKINDNQMGFIEMWQDNIIVNVDQFFGIESEDFPCEIAKVGMWLMDHLMNNIISDYYGLPFSRLPLKKGATIIHGNALRLDWDNSFNNIKFDFIIGNPPFIGKKYQNSDQKNDMRMVFGTDFLGVGNLDYVSAWYKKTTEYMNKLTKAAFVSTNSIVQGEQVPYLWKPLFNEGIHFDFCYRTFEWKNDAKLNAAVHCVIIGFSKSENVTEKYIFDDVNIKIVENINPYLNDGPTVFLENRSNPISKVNKLVYGSFALDNGNYTISEDEFTEFINKEPYSQDFLRLFIGSEEFINNKKRFCIWLKDADIDIIQKCPTIIDRIRKVKEWRLKSNRKETRSAADFPSLFAEIRQPKTDYLAIPITSSERRKYIPIGYLRANVIASNHLLVLPNASLYDFAILTSAMHMAWVKTVAGRLKSDYNYSARIVYNNFPWPNSSKEQIDAISLLGESILRVRASFTNKTLAALYDPLFMPEILMQAHLKLDRAVDKLYGKTFESDESRASYLMMLYDKLIK